MDQNTNEVEVTGETAGTGTVSDMGDADQVIKFCLDNKIDKSVIDEILNQGYTSMEAFKLIDMEDLQTPKIPKGQWRLLLHIAKSLASPAPTEPTPGASTNGLSGQTAGSSGSGLGTHSTNVGPISVPGQTNPGLGTHSTNVGLISVPGQVIPGLGTHSTNVGPIQVSGPINLDSSNTSGPGITPVAGVPGQPASGTSQSVYNQTLINTLMAQQQQLAQLAGSTTQQPTQSGAYAMPTAQPTWNDPQIHLASATGKSVTPYLDICDFVPSSIEEEVLIGGNGDQRIVVKSGPKKPILENLTLSQWSIANMAILYKLINEGKLQGSSLLDYLSHTTKIYQLVQRFNLPSVLLYDRECRKLQAAMNFRWGTDVQHLHKLHLIPRDRPQTHTSNQNKKPPNPNSQKQHPAKREVNAGLPRSGKKVWKMKFFPGQGKVREFQF